MNTKNLDYKWIGILMLMCLGFSGLGYVFMLITETITDPQKVQNFDCNSLNATSMYKANQDGYSFNNLDAYKKSCEQDKKIILHQPITIGVTFMVGIPIIVFIVCAKVFGIHKDETSITSGGKGN
jgi:hypothetical protein